MFLSSVYMCSVYLGFDNVHLLDWGFGFFPRESFLCLFCGGNI